jgi:hypothetical protein
MRLIFTIFFAFISISSASGLRTQELSTKAMSDQKEEIAKLAADEISKSLPQTIDKYTKLSEVKSQKNSIIYIFEIDTAPKSDETVRKEDHSRMKNAVTQGVCRSSKRFLDANIDIRYIYKSAHSKAELFTFDISQESCLNYKE